MLLLKECRYFRYKEIMAFILDYYMLKIYVVNNDKSIALLNGTELSKWLCWAKYCRLSINSLSTYSFIQWWLLIYQLKYFKKHLGKLNYIVSIYMEHIHHYPLSFLWLCYYLFSVKLNNCPWDSTAKWIHC